MELFFFLLILLVMTRAFGEIALRAGQPSLIGEIVAGIVLAALAAQFEPTRQVLSELTHDRVFNVLTDLGIFFVMLYAGLELQPSKILKNTGGALAVATGGLLLPLGLGLLLGWLVLPESVVKPAQTLLLGTALSITAVPESVRILIDLDRLETRVGQIIVSAAVVDDVFSLLLLAVLMALVSSGVPPTGPELGLLVLKVALFFVISVPVGYYLFPVGGRVFKRILSKEHDLSALLIAAFGFAVLAEYLELHFIVGAFLAGVFFGRKTIDEAAYENVEARVSGMTFGFLSPVFFASIGLKLDLSAMLAVPAFLAALLVVAFVGKTLGAGTAAIACGLSRAEAAAVGIGMNARGAIELVVADIALKSGLLAGTHPIVKNLFSSLVIVAVLTTLVSPLILTRLSRRF